MTPELIALVLACFVQVASVLAAGRAMGRDAGTDWSAGPRDEMPNFSLATRRLQRAAINGFEGLAFFTIAVLVLTLAGKTGTLTTICAWVYVAARILYIPAYARGLAPGRSIIWGIGFLATIIMLIASLL